MKGILLDLTDSTDLPFPEHGGLKEGFKGYLLCFRPYCPSLLLLGRRSCKFFLI